MSAALLIALMSASEPCEGEGLLRACACICESPCGALGCADSAMCMLSECVQTALGVCACMWEVVHTGVVCVRREHCMHIWVQACRQLCVCVWVCASRQGCVCSATCMCRTGCVSRSRDSRHRQKCPVHVCRWGCVRVCVRWDACVSLTAAGACCHDVGLSMLLHVGAADMGGMGQQWLAVSALTPLLCF